MWSRPYRVFWEHRTDVVKLYHSDSRKIWHLMNIENVVRTWTIRTLYREYMVTFIHYLQNFWNLFYHKPFVLVSTWTGFQNIIVSSAHMNGHLNDFSTILFISQRLSSTQTTNKLSSANTDSHTNALWYYHWLQASSRWCQDTHQFDHVESVTVG